MHPAPSESSPRVRVKGEKSNMNRLLSLVLFVPVFSIATAASDDIVSNFRARLRGLKEVPPVATDATRSFTATLSSDGSTLSYTVTYYKLHAQIIFSHTHLGI